MSLQFNISTYTEEFRSPCRGKPTRPRPSSANRRNNPHPKPDFLFPRRLQTGYGPRQTMPSHMPLDYGAHFFPPIRHLSVPYQEGKSPSLLLRPGTVERPTSHKPAESSVQASLLPSSGQLFKPQPFDSPSVERQFQKSPKSTQGKMEPLKALMPSNGHLNGVLNCFSTDLQTNLIQGKRRILANNPLKEQISKQPDNNTFLRYPKPQTYFKKSRSKTTLDPSAVYSCFQVVKPYKAGYYIIHPEFVSESLK